MKLILFIALLVGQVAVAQEAMVSPEIIEIRKSLPMEPTEKAVKDFIINRGSTAGLKAGAYVNVVREVAVNDPVRNKSLGALHIPVGKLQLIHVENNISVARLHSELGDDERPMLEYEALMIGDEVDLNSISMETPKASKKKWSTSAAASTEAATQVATQQPPTDSAPAAVAATAGPQPPAQTAQAPKATEPQETSELASTARGSAPPAPISNEPAFIITPIESEQDIPVKEKTSFVPSESATVTAATTAN